MQALRWLPVVALLLLVGCEREEPGDTVGMGDNFFEPEHLTVEAGTPVTFDNFGQVPHNAIDLEDVPLVVELQRRPPHLHGAISL